MRNNVIIVRAWPCLRSKHWSCEVVKTK